MDHIEMSTELLRLREENSSYRARLAEFERCDTTPPPSEAPTSRGGYALLIEKMHLLSGRIDTIGADAETAARMALEIRKNLPEAVRIELAGIVRGEVERAIKPLVERVDKLENNVVNLKTWRKGFTGRHCGECVLGGSDELGEAG